MTANLTEKQKLVLETLKNYWLNHQVPPSVLDVAKELKINKATAYEHLLALKKKGFLSHSPKSFRTWRPKEEISKFIKQPSYEDLDMVLYCKNEEYYLAKYELTKNEENIDIIGKLIR